VMRDGNCPSQHHGASRLRELRAECARNTQM
jgi:hypothetical protein